MNLFFILSSFIFLNSCCHKNRNKNLYVVNDKIVRTDSIVPNFTNVSRKSTISFTAVGDIMLGTNYPDISTLPPYDARFLFSEADSFLKRTDITFGNLEGTLLDSGGIPKGSGANIYCFRQPTRYVKYLQESGFDFLSIANNHINDFGPYGIQSTIKTLSESGLHFAGIPSYPFSIIIKDSIKIGLVAFAPHSGCIDMNDIEKASTLVSEIKKKCDILLVSFHGGAEGVNHQHVTRSKEYFFDQDRGNVYQFAHQMIDAGADIIIGHGPHVARGIELYKSHLISYSLGNFCTYGMFNLKGVSGVAPLLQFDVDLTGKFVKGKIYSFVQLNEGGPLKDLNNSAAKNVGKLSKEDFPESSLQIDDDGNIVLSK